MQMLFVLIDHIGDDLLSVPAHQVIVLPAFGQMHFSPVKFE